MTNLIKPIIVLGIITSVVTASALGSQKLYVYVKNLKKSKERWQDLFYDKLTQDDIAWG